MNTPPVALLWCILQVTLFALAAGAVHLIARRVQAALAAGALNGSFALILLLTGLAVSPWPRWEFGANVNGRDVKSAVESNAARPAAISTANDEPASAAAAAPRSAVPKSPSPTPLADAWHAFTAALADPPPAEAANEQMWSVRAVVWRLGLLGLLISVAWLAWGLWQVRRLVARSTTVASPDVAQLVAAQRRQLDVRREVEVRESAEVATPATVGWRRPVILLPTSWRDWTPAQRRAVFAHELAHVAGGDFVSWFAARTAVAIHFYHPLVRWLAFRLQLEQELAADATAAGLVGDRQAYLESLAQLALATPTGRVATPLRTLIPTRSLLVRRVEMLRTSRKSTQDQSRNRRSWLAWVCLLTAAVAVAGLRPPVVRQAVAAEPTAETTVEPAKSAAPERIDLNVLPGNTVFVASVRPAMIFEDAALQPFAKNIDEWDYLQDAGVAVGDLSEIMLVAYGDPFSYGSPRGQTRFVVRFTTPQACEKMIDGTLQQRSNAKPVAGTKYKTWRTNEMQVSQLDPSTLVVDLVPPPDRDFDSLPPLQNPAAPRAAAWREQWTQSTDRPLIIAVDMETFRDQLPPETSLMELGGPQLALVAPLLEHSNWLLAAIALSPGPRADVLVDAANAQDADNVAKTIEALLTLAGNFVDQAQAKFDSLDESGGGNLTANRGTEQLITLANEIIQAAQVKADGNRVELAVDLNMADAERVAAAARILMPAVQASRAAARRNVDLSHLKQIALAMHNYHDANGHFPLASSRKFSLPGATAPDRLSEYAHSWRVELLPYLEQTALYEQYRFDEPWDSEANQKVLAQMPEVFRSPTDDAGSTNASYFVLTGPETVFPDGTGTKIAEIRDGTVNTLLLVEAKRDIPWTKPEDIPYAADKPLPKLGGWNPGVFQAARCDGSVIAIAQNADEDLIRAMITKAGGETIE